LNPVDKAEPGGRIGPALPDKRLIEEMATEKRRILTTDFTDYTD
jgi:hypothetical protein